MTILSSLTTRALPPCRSALRSIAQEPIARRLASSRGECLDTRIAHVLKDVARLGAEGHYETQEATFDHLTSIVHAELDPTHEAYSSLSARLATLRKNNLSTPQEKMTQEQIKKRMLSTHHKILAVFNHLVNTDPTFRTHWQDYRKNRMKKDCGTSFEPNEKVLFRGLHGDFADPKKRLVDYSTSPCCSLLYPHQPVSGLVPPHIRDAALVSDPEANEIGWTKGVESHSSDPRRAGGYALDALKPGAANPYLNQGKTDGVIYLSIPEEAASTAEHMHARLSPEKSSSARSAYEVFTPVSDPTTILLHRTINRNFQLGPVVHNPFVGPRAKHLYGQILGTNGVLTAFLEVRSLSDLEQATHRAFHDKHSDIQAFERTLAKSAEAHEERVRARGLTPVTTAGRQPTTVTVMD